MKRNAVVLFCIILGIVFLVLSLLNLAETKEHEQKEPEKRLKTDNTIIDLSPFKEALSDQGKILAIGVMATASCAGCSTNMLEYSAYIDSVDTKFFEAKKIDKIYAVIGKSSKDAIRFKNMYRLKEKVLFFPHDSEIANILSEWGDRLLNQWVFVNKKEGKIYSRIMVLTAITPLLFKKDIVNRAIFASEAKTTTPNP